MSKIVLNSDQYEFNSSARTVTISSGVDITKESLAIITNVKSNKIIYNFGCEGFGCTISGQVITLELTDVGNSSDELQIILHQSVVEEIVENIELNTNRSEDLLTEILESNKEIVKYLRKIYNPE